MHGQELLRVHLHQGRVDIVPPEKLQHKAHRYYLAASKSLHQNQIYISPMDLNWENGKVEQPLESAIRLITPVFDAHGVKRGLLIINVLAEELLQRFMNKHIDFPGRSHLLNRQGDWLHDGEMADAWDFLLPGQHKKQFRDVFPVAWQAIHKHESGQIVNEQGMFTFATLRLVQAAYRAMPDDLRHGVATDMNNRQPVWKIVEYRSHAELAALTRPFMRRVAGYTLLFLLLAAVLVWRMVINAAQRERSEQKLSASESKFRHLLKGLPSAVVVLVDANLATAS